MYVAPVKMKETDPESRKELVDTLFDADKGVYVYYDMEHMDKLSKEDIQAYIDLYEVQKKADPSHASNYDSDIDRMNRLLQTTSKQREKAGDYSADEYMGMVGDLEYRLSFHKREKQIRYSGSRRICCSTVRWMGRPELSRPVQRNIIPA